LSIAVRLYFVKFQFNIVSLKVTCGNDSWPNCQTEQFAQKQKKEAPDVIRHDLEHIRIILKLAKFYAHVV